MTVPRYNQCTIWTLGEEDPRTGLRQPSIAREYQCERSQGGKTKLTDNKGAEFYPSSTFWIRSNDLLSGVHAEPKAGELIAYGLHSAVSDPSTVGAEVVRGVIVHSNAKFSESDSYTVGTSA